MKTLITLVKRNNKLFFKDKGMFFSALISPFILIVLYITFLGNTFSTSFEANLPTELNVDPGFINAYVAGWEFSSILAVCCVTVALVANTILVNDKISGAIYDLTIAPVKNFVIAFSYFISTALITFLITATALTVGFIYIACVGWYLSVADVFLLIADTLIMCLFGSAFSSILCHFLKTDGAVTAVSVIVSSVYGFICGAYYPISQFSKTMRNIVVFLPGTYGTSLFRQHYLNSVLDNLQAEYGFSDDAVENLKDIFDINLYFFENKVSEEIIYSVVILSTVLLIGVFILLNYYRLKRQSNPHFLKPSKNTTNPISGKRN